MQISGPLMSGFIFGWSGRSWCSTLWKISINFFPSALFCCFKNSLLAYFCKMKL